MAELRDDLILDIDQALRQITELENALNRALSQLVIDIDASAAQTQVSGLTDELQDADRAADRVADSADNITDELRQTAKAADRLEDEIDDVKKSVGKAADEGKRFSRTVSRDAVKATDRLKGQIVKLGTAIAAAFAVRAIVQFAASAVRAASDLEESANAVSVVFGEATATIEEFGRTSATSVGLAQSEFNSLATNTGALLTNFGFSLGEAADSTIILTQRAADLASVFNTEVSEALDAINAALRGETEPIRRYGISLSAVEVAANAVALGLASATSAVDTTAKAASAVNLIMGQSAKVAGDFANTSEGLANQQRILKAQLEDVKAEIGQAFIPALLAVATAAPTALEAIADLGAGLQVALDAFDALPTSIQISVAAIPALISAFAVAASSPALATVLAALVAIGAILIQIGNEARRQQSDVDALTESLIRFGEITPEAIKLALDDRDIARLLTLNVTLDDVAAALEDDTIKTGELGRALRTLNKQAPDEDFFIQPSKLFDTIDALDDLDEAFGLATISAKETRDNVFFDFEIARFQEQGRRYRAELRTMTTEFGGFNSASAEARAEFLATADAAAGTGQVFHDVTVDTEALGRASFGLALEQEQLEEGIQSTLDSFVDWRERVEEESAKAASAVDDSISKIINLFEGAPEQIETSIDEMLANIREQVTLATEFRALMETFAAAGLDALRRQFVEAGPAATDAARLLANDMGAAVEANLGLRFLEFGDGLGLDLAERINLGFADKFDLVTAGLDERFRMQRFFDENPITVPVILSSRAVTVPGGTGGRLGETSNTSGDFNFTVIHPLSDDLLGDAAQAVTIISSMTGLIPNVPR